MDEAGQVLDGDLAESLPSEDQEADVIVDILSGLERPRTEREELIQRMVRILAAEYHFSLESMDREVQMPVEENNRRRTRVADLVIYQEGSPRGLQHIERIVVVQGSKVKPTDSARGVPLLELLLQSVESCEFGVWTNGHDIAYERKVERPLDIEFEELSDFPGRGESLSDLERPDRQVGRVAVAEDLRDTVLRCHDYLYGNQAMMGPRAFSEMIKLIFCKIYDERRLRDGRSSRRKFWVGVRERGTSEGQQAISDRIKDVFKELKRDPEFGEVFKPSDEIDLQPRQLGWVAGELARYQFLDAEVDVKGMAYEAMVATTMKRERGQFFTPRNVVEAMVEILAPLPNERVLDPACGSGRFLVACLDRFRQQRAIELCGDGDAERIRHVRNGAQVLREAAHIMPVSISSA